jgi:mRNA interferase MazF
MRRGEIRWVDLDPARGAESSQRRPAVVVSNDGANATAARLGRGVVTVVPVTSNIERLYPFHVLLTSEATGLRQDSKAQAEQVRSVAVERIGARVGSLSGTDMAALDDALRLHLAL